MSSSSSMEFGEGASSNMSFDSRMSEPDPIHYVETNIITRQPTLSEPDRRPIPISTNEWRRTLEHQILPYSGVDFLKNVPEVIIQQTVQMNDSQDRESSILENVFNLRSNIFLIIFDPVPDQESSSQENVFNFINEHEDSSSSENNIRYEDEDRESPSSENAVTNEDEERESPNSENAVKNEDEERVSPNSENAVKNEDEERVSPNSENAITNEDEDRESPSSENAVPIVSHLEQENRFIVKEPAGDSIFVAKETSHWLQRAFLRSSRGFSMAVIDQTQQAAFLLERRAAPIVCCCSCALQQMTVLHPSGVMMGQILQECSWSTPRFLVCDLAGNVIYKIVGPSTMICSSYTEKVFSVYSADGLHELSQIAHVYNDVLRDYQLVVTFPQTYTEVLLKALLIGAAFLLEYMFFEQSKRASIFTRAQPRNN